MPRNKKTSGRLRAGGLLICAAAGVQAVASPAFAQNAAQAETPAVQIEEVVVTARRREERLQDTPVAVTALAGEALESRGVESVDQIAKFAPSIRFDGAAALSGGNYNATVFIRGVGQNDFAIFSDPGVGVYVDGVYYARSIGGTLDAFDVSRIEVLRGPQGTLFGKNTIGGAVIITTDQPKDEFGGKIEGVTGSYDRLDVKGHVDIPLGEKVAVRLSAARLTRDGYGKRLLTGDDLGDRNATAARAQLRWEASDAVTVSLSADYTRAREHSAPQKLLVIGAVPGFAVGPFMANFNTYVAPGLGITAPNGARTLNTSFLTDSPFTTYGTGPNINDLDLWGGSATVDWNLGEISFKSITAVRGLKATFARDGDNTPFTFRETFNHDVQAQYSQEFQLSGLSFGERLTWVTGAYVFQERGTDSGYAKLALGLAPGASPPPYSPSAAVYTKVTSTTYALFAQGSLSLTDRLSATVGARYNRDEKDYVLDHRRIRDGGVIAQVRPGGSWNSFTPKVGLEFKATPDVLLYASVGKGFKSGGFNARPLNDASEVTEYQPETLLTYEAGAKTAWLDRRLILNVAGYFSDYQDIQVTVNQTPRNFVANAAAGEVKGVEVELQAKPTANWSFNFGGGYMDAKYTEVGSGLAAGQVLPITLATHFVKAPKWTLNGGVEYGRELPGGGRLTARVDWTRYSTVYNDVANDPDLTQPGYDLFGARLAYASPDRVWQAALFGTNLSDERYMVSGNASSGFGLKEASFGRPREWGLSLSRKF
ncbi:TonB-dependent receptor [Caulobacter sp. Root1472]|uniref:TonB-dependent receptor n=1 Tax=Caulobacter sp. Root1472 TaxID=1736470 RepID=UPI0006F6B881|nr:TonB-dependent receptor [Caulobacter sp. Root1472]KQZ21990.1 TonB-dependent receptor [Caulobacter sp. Root1472]